MKDNKELLAIADGIVSFCNNITKVGCDYLDIEVALRAAMDNHRATEIQSKIRDLTPIEQATMYKALRSDLPGKTKQEIVEDKDGYTQDELHKAVETITSLSKDKDGKEKKPRGRPRKAKTVSDESAEGEKAS